MGPLEKLKEWLLNSENKISSVVDFDPSADLLYPFDFTAANLELTDKILADTSVFSSWVNKKLADTNSRYGIGGYAEHRTIYSRSIHFDTVEEPRRLHLGVDIWGPAGTPVYNFYDAVVHSFRNNDHFGDYGGTIILKYELDGLALYALYGHLSLASIAGLKTGQFIAAGTRFAAFGIPAENGNWPPHLHFQLMFDMQGREGDYPGVCQFSNQAVYLNNCPDPGLVLHHTFKLPNG
ncbi:murein DD-endopeptidase MepM/ murein hydrolase activator NlpD [Pedobacter cryoconitis]|uniref:peptidoglycan DD-metalloendopeptidase family protein n=1 Tax=Pedobacter cryoconitis TaxID=188932 RepID=UPI00160846EB|nr:peptidoglycan DD-metalloendopeptidase family protein [Pedobacter cryoconitis]MBB6274789.1 murein DD-endopeptidase MepM/ murein hydrolase activator NlpD [Pedobacter cryoconitis]